MKVLSLFDGISCGQVALHRAGFKPSLYMASEINKSAIRCTLSNFPDTVQLGDVINVRAMAEAGAIGTGEAYHGIGNGWTVDVVAHIFKGMHS